MHLRQHFKVKIITIFTFPIKSESQNLHILLVPYLFNLLYKNNAYNFISQIKYKFNQIQNVIKALPNI